MVPRWILFQSRPALEWWYLPFRDQGSLALVWIGKSHQKSLGLLAYDASSALIRIGDSVPVIAQICSESPYVVPTTFSHITWIEETSFISWRMALILANILDILNMRPD